MYDISYELSGDSIQFDPLPLKGGRTCTGMHVWSFLARTANSEVFTEINFGGPLHCAMGAVQYVPMGPHA